MPAAPADGEIFRLICSATVTALTVSANTSQTVVGSATTCGASTSHAWFYVGGTAKTWYLNY